MQQLFHSIQHAAADISFSLLFFLLFFLENRRRPPRQRRAAGDEADARRPVRIHGLREEERSSEGALLRRAEPM